MYEDYMQNFFYPSNQYRNTYGELVGNYPYNYNGQNFYQERDYGENIPPFIGGQSRNVISSEDIEKFYPEIYKVVYPMVRKVCNRNVNAINQEIIDSMVEEVYSNIEANNEVVLNINLGNDVRSSTNDNTQSNESTQDRSEENRNQRKNSLLNDIIRILILRELIGKPRNCIGQNCRSQRPPMYSRPTMPRYEYENYPYVTGM